MEFAGRTHFIIGQENWQEVAQSAADWLEQNVGRSSARS